MLENARLRNVQCMNIFHVPQSYLIKKYAKNPIDKFVFQIMLSLISFNIPLSKTPRDLKLCHHQSICLENGFIIPIVIILFYFVISLYCRVIN